MDNHYTQPEKRRALQALVQTRLGLEQAIHFVDSQQSPLVQLADFVAGAVNYARAGRSPVFYFGKNPTSRRLKCTPAGG